MYTENTYLKRVLFQPEYVAAGRFWSVNVPE
jgi:hypothetical protein